MIIVYIRPPANGWNPITYMAKLASEFLQAELIVLPRRSYNKIDKLFMLNRKIKRHKASESCLLICPYPDDLFSILKVKGWTKRFEYISAWIIDSFWTDNIPKTIKYSEVFDHFFITTKEDIAEWEMKTRTSTSWLPWGSDVLGLGGKDSARKLDLLRVGRQPLEWEDDSVTHNLCVNRIVFHGRPKFVDGAEKNQMNLMDYYRQAKCLLAFSNIVNPTSYTHPSKEYITGRWVDAIACGATIAGIPPESESAKDLLWDRATLNLRTTEINKGLDIIEKFTNDWSKDIAKLNYLRALERLDWRWRFLEIAGYFEIKSSRLDWEIQLLKDKISK